MSATRSVSLFHTEFLNQYLLLLSETAINYLQDTDIYSLKYKDIRI